MVKGFKKKNSKGGHDFIPTEKKTTRNAGDVDVEVDVNVKELDDFVKDKKDDFESLSNVRLTNNQKIIYDKLLDKNSVLTESDINYMKNTINNSFSGSSDEDTPFKDFIKSVVWEENENGRNGYKITHEQTEKGLKWLKKFYKNGMGYREQSIFDNFDEFRLIGWHDNAHAYSGGKSFYVPYYAVWSKDGNHMSYHMEDGKISIDG